MTSYLHAESETTSNTRAKIVTDQGELLLQEARKFSAMSGADDEGLPEKVAESFEQEGCTDIKSWPSASYK